MSSEDYDGTLDYNERCERDDHEAAMRALKRLQDAKKDTVGSRLRRAAERLREARKAEEDIRKHE